MRWVRRTVIRARYSACAPGAFHRTRERWPSCRARSTLARQRQSGAGRLARPPESGPMRLTDTDRDKLLLSYAADLAWRRHAGAACVSITPKRLPIISSFVLEGARDGASVAELMDRGRTVLGRDDVMDGIPEMPARSPNRSDVSRRQQTRHDPRAHSMIPGEIVTAAGNDRTARGPCTRTGHRAQHRRSPHSSRFARALSPTSTRHWSSTAALAQGMCLDIPAGTAVRFEPGIELHDRRRRVRRRASVVPRGAVDDRTRRIRAPLRADDGRSRAARRHRPLDRHRGRPHALR